MDPQADWRRREQIELYGDSVDVLAGKAQQLMGLSLPDLADIIGLSVPMLTKLLTGERVRIGNPIAIGRITQLSEFAEQLIRGEATQADISLTLAQIRASTTPARPSRVTAVAKSGGIPDATGPGRGAPSGLSEPTHRPDMAPMAGLAAHGSFSGGSGGPGPAGFVGGMPGGPPPAAMPQSVPTGPPSLTPASLNYARTVVGRHVPTTPSYRWPLLEHFTKTETWVKHENHGPTGAFKVRGGLNYLERLRVSGVRPAGLLSATRGNHGQSLAFAGREYGVPVVIVVPEGNSPDKNAAIEGFGAELIVHGKDFQAAREHAERLATERSLLAVPAFHPWLVEGVATYVAEMYEQIPRLDVIYVPLGMGSGMSAHIVTRDLMGLPTEIVGVVAEKADAYARSYEAGKVVATESADTFVDGVAVRSPDPVAVSIIRQGAARIIRVSEEEASEAMALMYRTTHNLVEPAGALSLAGMLRERDRVTGARVGLVATGGNCDFEILNQVMASE